MNQVEKLMQQAIADNVFPGAVLLVSRANSVLFHKAYGVTDLGSCRAMTHETVFDLASLTKPLATTLAVMMLIQQNRLGLEQHLGTVLPAFGTTDKSAIKINQLLYHNSGLPDYRPYYLELERLSSGQCQEALHNLLVTEPLIHPIGDRVLYSDIGFMILAWLIEYICGDRLDRIVSENIYEPLGLDISSLPSGKARNHGICLLRRNSAPGATGCWSVRCMMKMPMWLAVFRVTRVFSEPLLRCKNYCSSCCPFTMGTRPTTCFKRIWYVCFLSGGRIPNGLLALICRP